jgi:hypothetical protein
MPPHREGLAKELVEAIGESDMSPIGKSLGRTYVHTYWVAIAPEPGVHPSPEMAKATLDFLVALLTDRYTHPGSSALAIDSSRRDFIDRRRCTEVLISWRPIFLK